MREYWLPIVVILIIIGTIFTLVTFEETTSQQFHINCQPTPFVVQTKIGWQPILNCGGDR